MKWDFLLLAVIAACSVIAIGIFIAEESLIGILISTLVLFITMGYAFKRKKLQESAGK